MATRSLLSKFLMKTVRTLKMASLHTSVTSRMIKFNLTRHDFHVMLRFSFSYIFSAVKDRTSQQKILAELFTPY